MIKSIRKVIILNNMPFIIEEKRVLMMLRIPKINTLKEIPEEHISKGIKKAIELAYSLIKGKACYRTFQIKEVTTDRIAISESERLYYGNNMVRLLKDCDYTTLLVCTIGNNIVEKVEELKRTSLADAYYLDRAGAWMADFMAEETGRMIETEIVENGYSPTFRYAAGYGDWDLSAQTEIMRLTEANRIGVSVTETFIMVPRFSVSAVIGWERKS
jgi:hypothetical protein